MELFLPCGMIKGRRVKNTVFPVNTILTLFVPDVKGLHGAKPPDTEKRFFSCLHRRPDGTRARLFTPPTILSGKRKRKARKISEKEKKMVDNAAGRVYNLFCSQRAGWSETGVGEWCNGSTYDSDSYCLGSNPSSPAILPPLSSGLGHRPLKAETWVRIPLEVPAPVPRGRVFCLAGPERAFFIA